MDTAPWAGPIVPPIGNTPGEWLEVAGADFEVTLEPVYVLRDPEPVRVPNRYAIMGLEPWGVAKGRYRPVQNLEILQRAMKLGEVSGLGLLADGRRFFVVLERDRLNAPGRPAHSIVVQSSHDGTIPLMLVNVAWIAGSIIQLPIDGTMRARHTPNLEDTMEEDRAFSDVTREWIEKFERLAGKAAQAPLDMGQLEEVGRHQFQRRQSELVETWADLARTWAGRVGETTWAGVIAVCELLDGWTGYGDANNRLASALDDRSPLARKKALVVEELLLFL